ncbi:MAG TPA: hypothetical protein VFI59_01925 [Actinomycetota bacterium]|nr:hypothetical protein [Actinomycetota bacterium]
MSEAHKSLEIPPPAFTASFPLTEDESFSITVPARKKIPPPSFIAWFPPTEDESFIVTAGSVLWRGVSRKIPPPSYAVFSRTEHEPFMTMEPWFTIPPPHPVTLFPRTEDEPFMMRVP